MGEQPKLEFKIASEPGEFEQIHRLNYRTFVEEIPQHHPSESGMLVDKFHAENTYVICLKGGRLVGMVAFRAKQPFSLDQKLPDLDAYLPPDRTVCEVRLLAVERPYRRGRVLQGLLNLLVHTCRALGHDLAIISGAASQQRLYRHLGFVPFGPPVGTPEAPYQPMYLTLEAWDNKPAALARAIEDPAVRQEPTLLRGAKSRGGPRRRLLPRYLDRGLYAANQGVPFSHSSNLVYALQSAVSQMVESSPFARIAELSAWLRPQLRRLGLRIVAPDAHASPAVVTLALPPTLSSLEVGEKVEQAGYLLSYRSAYLARRNWLQVALMGKVGRPRLEALRDVLAAACRPA